MTIETSSERPVQINSTAAVSLRGKIGYGMMLAGALVLAASGIGTFVSGNAPMTHWGLMIHVAAAPLFAIGLAWVALTWPNVCGFGRESGRIRGISKFFFWLILACGLIVLLSGVVPMTPLFGTQGQHVLYLTHRYSGIVFAITLVLHLLTLRRTPGRQPLPG